MIHDLLSFMEKAPTAFHAAEELRALREIDPMDYRSIEFR